VSIDMWTIVFGFAGLLINGAGLTFLAIQVSLARHQAARTQQSETAEVVLQRKASTVSFLVATFEQDRTLRGTLPDAFDEAAVAAFAEQAISGDYPAVASALEGYLMLLETLALGVSIGIYDFETVFQMFGARINAVAKNYRPYIERRRQQTGVRTLYIEIEQLSNEVNSFRGYHQAWP
jgi:hypothetical protein